jgi:predicted nucleic acid-binding protein
LTARADRFTVVLDTDVLVGALTRNIILSLAEAGFFRPRWSHVTIGEEFERAFVRMHPGHEATAARQRANIQIAFPEGQVAHDPLLIGGLELPDPDDRHVLAAAIRTKAHLIVTNNLRDFPVASLADHELEAITPDDFIADCIDLGGSEAVAALRAMRVRFRKPALDADALILRIEQVGLGQTALLLEAYRALL